MKLYTSPSQFGGSASATPSALYASMPANSILFTQCSNLTNSGWNFPNTYLSVEIVRFSSSRGYVHAYGKNASHNDYRMFLGSDNDSLTGTWVRETNYNSFTVESVSADNVTVEGDSYATGSISCSKSGYTPLGVVGYRVSNASSSGVNSSRCYIYRLDLSGTTVTYNIANRNTSADAKVLITVNVLYVAN